MKGKSKYGFWEWANDNSDIVLIISIWALFIIGMIVVIIVNPDVHPTPWHKAK